MTARDNASSLLGSRYIALVALVVLTSLWAPSPAQAQATHVAKSEAEFLVPAQGGAAEIPLHIGEVCILAFPDKLASKAIGGSPDYKVMAWDMNTLVVSTSNGDAPPATMAIATTAGLKVSVTLRVVPAEEPALTMVRFRSLSEAQTEETRVTTEVAKRLKPAQQRLEQAQSRLAQERQRLEQARQRLDELTRRRSREATLAVRLAWGSAEIWDVGTDASAEVGSRGFAVSASLGVRHWLDLGIDVGTTYLGEASYPSATLPIAADMLSGPLRRTTNTAQLRGLATLRVGDFWMPFAQLALGGGARFRSTAALYVPTAQGERWLPPDDQGEELSFDLVTGVRAGLERRITLHWTAGLSVAVTHAFGISRPDLRMSEISFSLSHSRLAP